MMAALCVAITARSQESSRTSSLSWLRMPGADACIATQPLARSVEERLGRSVFVSASAADVSVEGRIEKKGAGFKAVITLRDAKGALLGTRQLERKDGACEAMNAELALVIAVMIDPDAAVRPRTEDAGAPEAAAVPNVTASAPPPPPPTETAAPPPPPPSTPPERDRWRVGAAANIATSIGIAPHPTLGAGANWTLLFPKVPLALRGAADVFYPTTAIANVSAQGTTARATYDLVMIQGALCPLLRDATLDVLLCGGTQIGGLRARDVSGGVKEETLPVVNLTVEGRLAIRMFGPLEMSGGVGGVLPLTHGKSTYGNETLHEVSPFAFQADVGVGVSLYP